MKHTDLYILDEINVGFDGLEDEDIDCIIKETKLIKKGAHMTAAYQMKLDDGMVSHFEENGLTFFYMLNKVLPIIEDMGYTVDVFDERAAPLNKDNIGNDLLKEYGIELYYYQVDAINKVINNERGIIEVATSGGKSFIAAGLTKVYEDDLDFLIIVPTEKLVKQIYKDFTDFGIDIGHIKKGMTKKRVAEEWNHKHMVCTWRMVNNNRDKIERFGGFVYDEAHIMGDVMRSVFRKELANARIRVGMTGSLPTKDKQKCESIYCHIGGETLIKVEPKELQDGGFISTCDIDMIALEHEFDYDVSVRDLIDDWEWSQEEDYLYTNIQRLDVLAEKIEKLPDANMLILCFKEVAENLKKRLGYDMIHGDIKEKERDIYYDNLEKIKNYRLIATFDTVGTGTSIDEITHLVLIDAGKNEIRIIQGIGRGLRRDGDKNHVKITDYYSKLVYRNPSTDRLNNFSYSSKHAAQRKKEYTRLHYPFKELSKVTV
jgi:superfamily II DNA or RNA helicase